MKRISLALIAVAFVAVCKSNPSSPSAPVPIATPTPGAAPMPGMPGMPGPAVDPSGKPVGAAAPQMPGMPGMPTPPAGTNPTGSCAAYQACCNALVSMPGVAPGLGANCARIGQLQAMGAMAENICAQVMVSLRGAAAQNPMMPAACR